MKFTIEMNIYELSRSIHAGTLETLVTDIQDHEDQTRNKKPTGQLKAEPTTSTVSTPEPITEVSPPEPTPEPTADASTPDKPEITEVQIRAKFVELNKKGKKKELKALLDEIGVSKVSDLQPDQYQAAWDGLEAM